MCLKLDLVILCFFDGVFSRFLGTRWLICSLELFQVEINAHALFAKPSYNRVDATCLVHIFMGSTCGKSTIRICINSTLEI